MKHEFNFPPPKKGPPPKRITTNGPPGGNKLRAELSPAAKAGDPDITKPRITHGADDLNTPNTPLNAMRRTQAAVRPGASSIADGNTEEQATPEEQAEHDRMLDALSQVLYKNERTSNAVVQQLTPDERVGSIAKASMMVISQMDQKFNFDEVVIPEMTKETVDRVADLYENAFGEELSDEDLQAALGATWEGVMETFGLDEQSYAQLTQGMSDDEFKGYEQQYKQFLGEQ